MDKDLCDIQNNISKSGEIYYTFEEIQNDCILGKTIGISNFNKYIYHIKIKGRCYYPKSEILKLRKLRDETISAQEIVKLAGWVSVDPIRDLARKLQKEGRSVELITKHALGKEMLVKGYEEVIRYIKEKSKYDQLSPTNQFKYLIEKHNIDITMAERTLSNFCTYVDERYQNICEGKTCLNARGFARIYEFLANNMDKEIETLSIPEIERLTKSFKSNASYQEITELKSYFLGYLSRKQILLEYEDLKKDDILGNIIGQAALNKIINPIKIFGRLYYSWVSIEPYIRIKNETMKMREIAQIIGWKSIDPVKKVVELLKQKGKDIELITKHPFGDDMLIKGYDCVVEYVKEQTIVNQLNTIDKFKFEYNKFDIDQHSAKKTLHEFERFVENRFDFLTNLKKQFNLSSYIRLLNILYDNLKFDITNIEEEEINNLRNAIRKGAEYTENELKEFNWFIKYLDKSKFKLEKYKYVFGKVIEDEYSTDYISYKDMKKICLRYIFRVNEKESHYTKERIIKSIEKHLCEIGIEYHKTKLNIYINKVDGKKFEEYYKNFNSEDYFTAEELVSDDVLGISVSTRFNKFVEPVMFNGKAYYLKEKVLPFIKIRNEAVRISDISKRFEWTTISPILTIIKHLQADGVKVECIIPESHPFGNVTLVLGHEEVIKRAVRMKNIKDLGDSYEKYEFLVSELDVEISKCKKTLKNFSEFVKKRTNDLINSTVNVSAYVRIYKCLMVILKKEIILCNKDELKKIIIQIRSREGFCNIDEVEFNYFISYCNEKYDRSILPKTKNVKKSKEEVQNKECSYTREQWYSLKKLVFESINNPECIKLIQRSRVYSMVWLYIALHFVTAWRAVDMRKIPKPDLSIINFANGKEFLDYFRSGGTFTKNMGDLICENVRAKMKSFGHESKKTGQPLRMVIDESLVRAIGLLFATAEAHRQNPRSLTADKDHIITTSVGEVKYHRILFGTKYVEILQGETFSNLKATSTHQKLIQEKGGVLALYRGAVMRGHSVAIGDVPRTTANIYAVHGYMNKDRDLHKISLAMFDRGIFSFAAYKILYMIDNRFASLKYEEQTNNINKLGLTANEIENLSRTVLEEKIEVDSMINEMFKCNSKKNIIECLYKISVGEPPAKHHYTSCLLKAMVNSNLKYDRDKFSEYNKHICILPEATTCFGCMVLVY